MPRGVKVNLTPEQRADIREMRALHPNMTLRTIGERFKVTPACIHGVLNPKVRLHEPTHARQAPTYKPPRMAPGLSLSLLMGGNARRARPVTA